jgi:hypothetical protein
VGLTKHITSVVVVAVLTVAPVTGTLCAFFCAASATKASSKGHHGAGMSCEAPASASQLAVRGLMLHDCSNHEASVRQVFPAGERFDQRTTSSSIATLASPHVFEPAVPLGVALQYRVPPGTAPPSTRYSVLRI